MQKNLSLLVAMSAMIFLVACVGPQKADNYQPLTVSFEWNGNGGSLSSPNPEIHVSNIPAGTAFFEVAMRDIDRPKFDHGGGTVPFTGEGVIPVGALNNYRGPQPPAPEVHTYVITVRAWNADHSLLLGEGRASRRYPQK